MTLLRRALFYVFLVAYLVICPLTILYAFGYAVHPGAQQRIVKTGLIYLSTSPSGASIYIGRRRFTKKTPASLPGLLPGDYPVRLVLKNHAVWQQTVPVEAEKATVLENVLLLPVRLKPRIVLPEPYEQLLPLLGGRRLLLTRGPRLGDIVVYDTRSDAAWPLLPPGADLREANVAARYLVKGSPRVLVRVEDSRGWRWLWIEVGRAGAAFADLTTLFLERPDDVQWAPRSRHYLFSIQGGSVHRVDAVNRAVSPRWLTGVAGFGVTDREVYMVAEDGRLLRVDSEGRNASQLAELPLSDPPWLGARPFHHVKAFAPDTILALSDRGELLAPRAAFPLVEGGVVGLEWDANRRRLLCWQHSRIGIIEFNGEAWDADEPEPPPQLQWVYQEGARITEAWWAHEGSHVIFRDGERLHLLALDTYGPPQLAPLLEVKRDSAVAYMEEVGAVYYLDPGSSQLSSLQVVPKRERLSLPPLETTARRRSAGSDAP